MSTLLCTKLEHFIVGLSNSNCHLFGFFPLKAPGFADEEPPTPASGEV